LETIVAHVSDASRSVPAVARLLGDSRDEVAKELRKEYQSIRERWLERQQQRPIVSITAARRNCPAYAESGSVHTDDTGTRGCELLIDDLWPLIDWGPFFLTWGLRASWQAQLKKSPDKERYEELLTDAEEMRGVFEAESIGIKARYGIYDAYRDGDDIVLTNEATKYRFHMLRQQESRRGGKAPYYSLADFVSPTSGNDTVGGFVVTAGLGLEVLTSRFEAEHDDYRSIMAKALADRLAEAAAEYVHRDLRIRWGIEPSGGVPIPDLLKTRFQGIRPAHGYPACPDHTEKETLWALLDGNKVGATLSEHFAMIPAASVSGLIFPNADSRYFAVGRIGRDQVADYAERKGWSMKTAERWLAPNLSYDTEED